MSGNVRRRNKGKDFGMLSENFIESFAKVFGLNTKPDIVNTKNSFKTDKENLRSDWEKIGEDFRKIMPERRENSF